MTLIRQMTEIAGQKDKVLKLRSCRLGPPQIERKIRTAVPATSFSNPRSDPHRTSPHLMRQPEALTLRPALRNTVQIKYQQVRALPHI